MDEFYDNPDYAEAEMDFRDRNLSQSAEAFLRQGITEGLSPSEVLERGRLQDAPDWMAHLEAQVNRLG